MGTDGKGCKRLPGARELGMMGKKKEAGEQSALNGKWRGSVPVFCQRPTLLRPSGQIWYYNSSNSNKLYNSKHLRYSSSFDDPDTSVRKVKLREVNNLSKVELVSGGVGL